MGNGGKFTAGDKIVARPRKKRTPVNDVFLLKGKLSTHLPGGNDGNDGGA